MPKPVANTSFPVIHKFGTATSHIVIHGANFDNLDKSKASTVQLTSDKGTFVFNNKLRLNMAKTILVVQLKCNTVTAIGKGSHGDVVETGQVTITVTNNDTPALTSDPLVTTAVYYDTVS